MPRRRSTDQPSAEEIDRLYGLEPVIEPGQHRSGEPSCFVDIDCPSCGEHYAIEIDLTVGDFSHIEDCQVCCQPMQVNVELNQQGRLTSVRTLRLDEI